MATAPPRRLPPSPTTAATAKAGSSDKHIDGGGVGGSAITKPLPRPPARREDTKQQQLVHQQQLPLRRTSDNAATPSTFAPLRVSASSPQLFDAAAAEQQLQQQAGEPSSWAASRRQPVLRCSLSSSSVADIPIWTRPAGAVADDGDEEKQRRIKGQRSVSGMPSVPPRRSHTVVGGTTIALGASNRLLPRPEPAGITSSRPSVATHLGAFSSPPASSSSSVRPVSPRHSLAAPLTRSSTALPMVHHHHHHHHHHHESEEAAAEAGTAPARRVNKPAPPPKPLRTPDHTARGGEEEGAAYPEGKRAPVDPWVCALDDGSGGAGNSCISYSGTVLTSKQAVDLPLVEAARVSTMQPELCEIDNGTATESAAMGIVGADSSVASAYATGVVAGTENEQGGTTHDLRPEEDDDVYSREDGSFRRADGTYGHWGTDGNYYVGFWGDDGQYHEGYRDGDNVYWEGYWTDDGQWVDLSVASPSSTSLSSSYSSILNIAEAQLDSPTAVMPVVLEPKEHDDGLTEEEKAEAKRVKMQKHVMDEILATERDYVKDLTFVVERFQRPMIKLAIIDATQSSSLFSNLHLIKGVNESLLAALEKHDAGQSSMDIGSIFSEIAPYLKIYSMYINNIDKQERLYNHLYKTQSNFRVLCDSVRALPESKHLDLPAYLAKPMQRICKYPLLFRELVRFTPPTAPEHRQLEEVCTAVAAVAQHINEMKAKAESQQKLAQLLSRLDGSTLMLVTATRRYLQEGSFIVQYYEGAPTKKGYLFLFSDAMLLGSPAGGLSSKIKPKRFLLLDDLIEVVDVPDSEHHVFEIVDRNPRVPDVARVWAESKEQKEKWMQSIRKVLARPQGAESKALQNLRPAVAASQQGRQRATTQAVSPHKEEKGERGSGKKKSFISGLDWSGKNKRLTSQANPAPAIPPPPMDSTIPPPLTATGGVPLSLASFPFPPLQPRSRQVALSASSPGITTRATSPPHHQYPLLVPHRPPPRPPSSPQHTAATTSLPAPTSLATSTMGESVVLPGGLLMSELSSKLGNKRGSAPLA